MRLLFSLVFALLLTVTGLASDSPLFDHLKELDGKTYTGRMAYPNDPGHDMNKPMEITVKVVSENEIHVPFKVGEDRSRTWILTRSKAGVQLKHDHRHPDGSPDELTNYGGLDTQQQLGTLLVFPADEETAQMLPEASTNVWTFRLTPDKSQLYYYLERDKKPRFEAVFELGSPSSN